MTTPLAVRTISAEEHLAFLRTRESAWRSHAGAERPTVSFLQTPAWAEVKQEWRSESIGWSLPGSPDGDLVGVALVLYRQLPRVKRFLAYLPEGPVIDWDSEGLGAWLAPMAQHLEESLTDLGLVREGRHDVEHRLPQRGERLERSCTRNFGGHRIVSCLSVLL